MHDHVFNGLTNYTLEKYNYAHRNAYVVMEQCSDQVSYQLPTLHTRVSNYLKVITSTDPDIRAGIASICQDKTGMLINFEDVTAYLALLCPVYKNRKETAKRPHGEISDITGEADTGSTEVNKGMGKGMGKTGV